MATKTYSINLGFGLMPLTILFIILKMTGMIAWSWLWVLAPLWLAPVLLMGMVLIPFLIVFIGGALVLAAGGIAFLIASFLDWIKYR